MKLRTYTLLFSYLLLSCTPGTDQTANNPLQVLTDSLTLELDAIYQRGFINGYGVALVNQDGALYRQGFGLADVKNQKPYTIGTLQNIASVSKTFLGLSLLKAQEMGKLNLDDPISTYLPFEVRNPYFPDEVITIRHLATHTSTITDTDQYGARSYLLKNASDLETARSIGSSSEFNAPEAELPLQEFLQNFLSEEGEWYEREGFLNQQPGERYEYTNIGATLAALILELATQQRYDDFTAAHILTPLGMSSSGWSFSGVDTMKHTKLYAAEAAEIPLYSLITYPDGGLITSISDMSNYLSELIKGAVGDGQILSKESYEEVFKAQLGAANFEDRDTDRPFDDEYNAGIFMGHTPSGYLGHMGGDPGVSTFLFFNPKTQTGRMLFINTDLDQDGVKQFYDTWDKLGEYELRLNQAANRN